MFGGTKYANGSHLLLSTVCIGLHLARLELSLAAAIFFREFPDVKISKLTTEKSMEMENHFLIAPKAHECFVILQ